MSCCGRNRQQLTINGLPGSPASPIRTPAPLVLFQYVGATALIALGAATGKHYRFDATNCIIPVDPRDQPSLRTIPQLRQVR